MPGFVTCVPTDGTPSVAPCVDDANGAPTYPVVMQLPAPGSVEFDNADLLFSFGLSVTLGIWAVGVAVGAILSVIKKG